MATRPTINDTIDAFDYQNPWLRHLPHYRTCFPSLARSCNPFVSSLRLRRIAFLIIVVLRVIESLYFALVWTVRKPSFLVPGLLITLLVFFFVAWNLDLIVEAEGERRLFGVRIPSGVFSVFLWLVVVVHLFLVGLEVTGLGVLMDGTLKTWGFWIVVMFLVALVAAREPEEVGLSLA